MSPPMCLRFSTDPNETDISAVFFIPFLSSILMKHHLMLKLFPNVIRALKLFHDFFSQVLHLICVAPTTAIVYADKFILNGG